jgi:formamidopyrimidine-DNA glycosylase
VQVLEFLGKTLPGLVVSRVEVRRPIVLRDLVGEPPGAALVGREVSEVGRYGKFLWIAFGADICLVINPKLAGRLAWRGDGDPSPGHTVLVLGFSAGRVLYYLDPKDMGQVYITGSASLVPGFAGQGPDALDPALTAAVFADRLRRFQGEIKGVLTRQALVAGVGNAYADEILFEAGISPFRRRARLSDAEVGRLYEALRTVLSGAVDVLRERVGDHIEEEVRDFLKVHGRGGQPCVRCGRPISELRARQRITSFCRGCQPGTLVRN